jgi:microsomal dipeptidase-like Zn-dependent dipeptidase
MQALAKELVAAGFSEADVRKIFAGNALRILSWGLTR